MTTTLVSLDDLHFSYRLDPVLRIDNWRWQDNEHWAITGGNGAGKTTLARLLRDEIRPQRGVITLAAGIDAERDIVYVSFAMQRALIEHDNRFDDSETNGEGTDVGTTVRQAILQGGPETERYRELVDSFGIGPILHRGIRYISTGESRKTLLARALYAAPKMLILDNPLEGLDRTMQSELSALIEKLLAGTTPLLLLLPSGSTLPRGITHVLELERGNVINNGTRVSFDTHAHATEAAHEQTELPAPLQRASPIALDAAPIEMRGVNVSYNDEPILKDIHWRFALGQHCCISGRNGAGKSTLLSLITGDNHKGYGQPFFLFGRKRGSGESVWELKANCGIVNTPMQLNHLNRQRVLEVVASGLYDTIGLYQNCTGREKELTLNWIHAVGLDALAEHRFDQLSFGEQRLALLARAMVKSPPLLILDEPCIGLDGAHKQQLISLVNRIAAQGHTQILYVSHVPEELPSCINQWLQLVPHADGGHTAVVSTTQP
ncbi:MAG: molybdenum transporter ATP-binding protein [Verrucomicrobiaceae bacterium]|nr:molybdenum transporter ATP-binding protein [Verrucomicrobiaceae bacterium]